MKMHDQVITLHGTGKIVAIESSKQGVRYGVLHDTLTFKLPKGLKQQDVIYYEKEELKHVG
jgi:hypothetical protein